jgi:hypothetical protein
MPEPHPAIVKRIDELLSKAKELTVDFAPVFELISKTIESKDTYGLKMRSGELASFANRMQWLAAQLDALNLIGYDIPAPEVRRTSSGQMQAVVIPRKDGE